MIKLRNLHAAAALCVAALLTSACGSSPATTQGAASPGAGPQGASPSEATSGDAKGSRSAGLATPSNDPKIVAAIKKVLDCKWTDEDGFDQECEAYKQWQDDPEILGEDEDKAALTLLNLGEDGNEKVRMLAIDKLPARGASIYQDKAPAGRIIAQAETEKSPHVAGHLGWVVSQINLEKTGLFPRIKKLAETHSSKDLRKAIFKDLLSANEKSREALDFALAGLKSDDHELRYVTLLGLRGGERSFAQEICAEYVRLLDDPEGQVAGLAAQSLGYIGPCTAQIDKLLAYAKKRGAAGGVKEWLIPNALSNLCRSDKTSEAQKKEAEGVAKTFASGKHDDLVRKSGLEAVLACNPTGGRAFVQGFANDKSATVKAEAERLLKAPAKK